MWPLQHLISQLDRQCKVWNGKELTDVRMSLDSIDALMGVLPNEIYTANDEYNRMQKLPHEQYGRMIGYLRKARQTAEEGLRHSSEDDGFVLLDYPQAHYIKKIKNYLKASREEVASMRRLMDAMLKSPPVSDMCRKIESASCFTPITEQEDFIIKVNMQNRLHDELVHAQVCESKHCNTPCCSTSKAIMQHVKNCHSLAGTCLENAKCCVVTNFISAWKECGRENCRYCATITDLRRARERIRKPSTTTRRKKSPSVTSSTSEDSNHSTDSAYSVNSAQ